MTLIEQNTSRELPDFVNTEALRLLGAGAAFVAGGELHLASVPHERVAELYERGAQSVWNRLCEGLTPDAGLTVRYSDDGSTVGVFAVPYRKDQ